MTASGKLEFPGGELCFCIFWWVRLTCRPQEEYLYQFAEPLYAFFSALLFQPFTTSFWMPFHQHQWFFNFRAQLFRQILAEIVPPGGFPCSIGDVRFKFTTSQVRDYQLGNLFRNEFSWCWIPTFRNAIPVSMGISGALGGVASWFFLNSRVPL